MKNRADCIFYTVLVLLTVGVAYFAWLSPEAGRCWTEHRGYITIMGECHG